MSKSISTFPSVGKLFTVRSKETIYCSIGLEYDHALKCVVVNSINQSSDAVSFSINSIESVSCVALFDEVIINNSLYNVSSVSDDSKSLWLEKELSKNLKHESISVTIEQLNRKAIII